MTTTGIFAFAMSFSQMKDSLTPTGVADLSLGMPIKSVKSRVIPFASFEFKANMVAAPAESTWYVYLDSLDFREMGVRIENVFVAVDDSNLVKRIKIFLTDPNNEIEKFCNRNFGNAMEGTSSFSGTDDPVHFFWYPTEQTAIYLAKPWNLEDTNEDNDTELTYYFLRDAHEFRKYTVRKKINNR